MNLGYEVSRVLLVGTLSFGALAGCGEDEPNWQYDEADMQAKFFGTWTGTITPTDEQAAPLTVTIRSHDDVARAPACGNRDFSGDEATPGLGVRCAEVTSLAVSATIVGDGADPEEADGHISVLGTELSNADLFLDYRSSDSRHLGLYWQNGEPWTSCGIGDRVGSNEINVAVCTLDERLDVTE